MNKDANGFEELEIIRGNYRATWEYIGEGWSGDYDPEDPEDIPLLRFSVDRHVDSEFLEWEGMDNASYCTRMPIDSNREHLERGLNIVLDEVIDAEENGKSYKRELERLSWFEPADFTKSKI